MRWAELAAFTPVMRTHEGNRPTENFQWWEDEAVTRHLAGMAALFAALAPYRAGLIAGSRRHRPAADARPAAAFRRGPRDARDPRPVPPRPRPSRRPRPCRRRGDLAPLSSRRRVLDASLDRHAPSRAATGSRCRPRSASLPSSCATAAKQRAVSRNSSTAGDPTPDRPGCYLPHPNGAPTCRRP